MDPSLKPFSGWFQEGRILAACGCREEGVASAGWRVRELVCLVVFGGYQARHRLDSLHVVLAELLVLNRNIPTIIHADHTIMY